MEFVYLIENIVTHRKYVGRTRQLERRVKLHKNALIGKRHPNELMQNDCNKYGIESFKFLLPYLDKKYSIMIL